METSCRIYEDLINNLNYIIYTYLYIYILLRLHSLCILQGGGQRILGGDLKFLEQKKGGYENCLNISGGMLIFCKILSSFCNGFKR